jgi:hypothetical protein
MPRFSRCAGSAILHLINVDGLLIGGEKRSRKKLNKKIISMKKRE